MVLPFDKLKRTLDEAYATADDFSFIDDELRPAYQNHILSILSGACMEVLGTRVERPDWVPYIPYYFPRATPNPDTVYSFAPIDPGGTYRLSGKLGNETLAAVTLRKGGAHLGTRPGFRVGEIDFSEVEREHDGAFSFLLSKERPASYKGQWFALHPETESLMLRRVTKESSEEDSICALERVDNVAESLTYSPEDHASKLDRMCSYTLDQNAFLLRYMAHLFDIGADKGFVADDQVPHGGLIVQQHYFHLYSLQEDEALIIEAKLPKKAKYWSIQTFTPFAATPDYTMRQSALNDKQAVADPDGVVRIVLALKDPGVANWLDPCGWRKGGIQWRWNDFDSDPEPKVTKVNIDQLQENLPRTTQWADASQRMQSLTQRAYYYQKRRR